VPQVGAHAPDPGSLCGHATDTATEVAVPLPRRVAMCLRRPLRHATSVVHAPVQRVLRRDIEGPLGVPRPAPTVRGMRIVIATAEPRGAYHLAPLAGALKTSGSAVVHLVPYPEPVQGNPVVEVVTCISVVADCDRVVVTGGTFSAWTELVARHAVTLGKPVVFSELAYVGNAEPVAPHVPVDFATALSDDGAASLSQYLGLAHVAVTGTPALDGLPAWAPEPKRALLLSTSDMVIRDPGLVLVAAAHALRQRGWDVRVRPHPREDRTPWDGFEVVDGETQAESAASAAVVVGYPGSAHVLAAAVGAPVIALSPTAALADVFTERQAAAMSAHAQSVRDVLDIVDTVDSPDPALVEAVVGPLGDASRRIVDLWTGAPPLRAEQ
jgi:hypothetical protein